MNTSKSDNQDITIVGPDGNAVSLNVPAEMDPAEQESIRQMENLMSSRSSEMIDEITRPNSPESRRKEFASMAAKLREIEVARNRIQFSEFQKFIPLYQETPTEEFGLPGSERWEDRKELSMEFYRRISPYEPIEIMSGDKILMTLPPIFNRVSELADDKFVRLGDGQRISLVDVTTMFSNIVAVDTIHPQKQVAVTLMMGKAFWASQSPEELVKNRKRFQELSAAFAKQSVELPTASTTPTDEDVEQEVSDLKSGATVHASTSNMDFVLDE